MVLKLVKQTLMAVVCGTALLAAATDCLAEERLPVKNRYFSMGLGFDFATGKYGTGTTTDFISVPLILDWYPTERLDFELQVPFIYQSNSTTPFGATMPFRAGSRMAGATVAGRFTGGSSGVAADQSHSRSGIGDVVLTSGFIVAQEQQWAPQVRPTLYIKFPTADRDEGLGTGEFDAGIGLALTKWLGDWRPYVEASYVFQGSSDIFATRDYVSYEAGIGYLLTETLYTSVVAKGATPPFADSPALFEGRVKFNYTISRQTSLEGYLAKGFTNGSPDFGAGVALFYDL